MPEADKPDAPLIIQTEHLDEEAAAWLSARARLEVCAPSDESFAKLAPVAQGLLVRTYTRVDDALLDRLPMLKVVARAGVGLDNVDLRACARRGVRVVSTPDANTRAVVEYVTALMLDATRPRLFLGEPLELARWKEVRSELRASTQLCELTLGLWGFGRIGSAMARVGAALEMRVIYHDLLEIPEARRSGAVPVSRQELCAQSDILSVHVDGRSGNRGLVSTDDFGRMRSGVVFVNTSRGFVVDNHALAAFMIAHPSASALLDVHEPEPFDATYPLLEIENVHLSPHIASATDLAQKKMSWVVRDLWRVLAGEAPEHEASVEQA